MAWITV